MSDDTSSHVQVSHLYDELLLDSYYQNCHMLVPVVVLVKTESTKFLV